MPVMSRGPELELSTIKDVEDLKHTLAKAMIHVPNDVLRRAIILPKDLDTTNNKYPTPKDFLPKNPATDPEQLWAAKQQRKLMKDLLKWQQSTFPWRAIPKDEEEGETKTKEKVTKTSKKKKKKKGADD